MEVKRAVRWTMGPHWCVISGDWNPREDGADAAALSCNNIDLKARNNALFGRAQDRYRARADRTNINQCAKGWRGCRHLVWVYQRGV